MDGMANMMRTMQTQGMYGYGWNVAAVKGSPYEFTPEEQFINHLKMKTLAERVGPEHLVSDFILKMSLDDPLGLTEEVPHRRFKLSGMIILSFKRRDETTGYSCR
jgi:hypothetical protein